MGYFEPNFVCKLSGTRKWKFMNMMLVAWPRWLPSPYMVKTLQKSSSPESVDQFPRNLGKFKFVNISFYIEKWHSDGFFENFAACDLEIGWYTTKWVNIGLWGSLVLCQTSYRYPRPRYQVSVYRTNGLLVLFKPHHEKTNILHMRKQRCRSASRLPRSWSAPLFSLLG